MVFLGGLALACCCRDSATEVEGRLTGGQEFDLFLFFVASGFCAKILLWWRIGNTGSGPGLLLSGLQVGLTEGLLELSRCSSDVVLDFVFFFLLLLMLLELLEDPDFFLLCLLRLLDLLGFLLCFVDEDL